VNFGVPGLDTRSAPLQPIMSNKFRITFYDFGDNTPSTTDTTSTKNTPAYVLTQQVRSTALPTWTQNNTQLYSYVSTVYIATRAEWGDMQIRFLDDITNGVYGRVMQQCAKQQNMFDQTTSRAGENYKFEMDLDILAGGATAGQDADDPNILRRFSYAGCFITAVDGAEMNYATADVTEFAIHVRYDNVISFDNFGNQMGTFSQTNEINSRIGISSTGIGVAAGGVRGVAVSANSVNVIST
jgi:hypothetical protein